ncbi:MAG: response regulator [Candidatus Melainabacteria bacterium]|nr:MAG: response regulator [Candidatus Melainabacteria bacterium]
MNSVLILDDDQYFRALVAAYLQDEGLTTVEARTGSEATDALSRQKFALVIVDYRLPDCDGLSWINYHRLNGVETPFIVLSGIALNNQKQTRMRNLLGVEHVLQKPINPFEFIRLIRKQLHMKVDTDPSVCDLEGRDEMQFFYDADLDEELDGELEDIKETYLHDLPALLRKLANTIEKSNESGFLTDTGKNAIMEAHKIRGTAGSLSLEGISDLAGKIETALKKAVRQSKKISPTT